MCLDEVNEPIDHYKINNQKKNEIQKRLNKLDKNKRKAVSMLFESDFNSLLKQSLLFSGILNKVDQMESRLVKQDEKISNIREKIKGFGSMFDVARKTQRVS